MTRDNFFHLGNSSRQGCSFSGTFPFVGLVEMFRMANEKSFVLRDHIFSDVKFCIRF